MERLSEPLFAELARVAAAAASLPEFRSRALVLVRGAVPFDGAVFHALSPRVPLETGAFVGLEPEALRASQGRWDEASVALGHLRELANAHDVATDAQAFPKGSALRAQFDKYIGKPLGARAVLVAHLALRGRVHSALVLLRRRAVPFTDAEVASVRALVPALALADVAHAALDARLRSPAPKKLACGDQRLTPRQREVVEHVALGHTNERIADAMGLSSNTLRNHLSRIFARLGAANRADVVRLAVLLPEEE